MTQRMRWMMKILKATQKTKQTMTTAVLAMQRMSSSGQR